jgi:low molecular weight protein-tyrosine phosphatase
MAVRICFVCLGNICRSPTAEGVMRALVEAAGLGDRVTLDSAGTGGWHVGESPDPRTAEAAARRGYDLTELRARQFRAADFDRFDLVVAMDRQNVADLRRLARHHPSGDPEIRLLRSFDPAAPEGAEVPDPYAGGSDGFERVLDICERACRGLLSQLELDPRASR